MHLLSKRAPGALLLLAATFGATFAATNACAQYVWIGANGTRQYSDRPPPPGTPPGKILKSPGRPAFTPETADSSAAAPDAAVAAPVAKGPPTLAERETAYRERGKAREEQERKQQEETTRQRRLAEHCEAARETQAQLASGIRIARIGPDGQKAYMTDEERADRNERVNRALQDCR